MENKEGGFFKITGVMSGTSLDGIDFAACVFSEDHGEWSFRIEHATTYAYSAMWKNKLKSLFNAAANDLAKTHFDYGKLIGMLSKQFHQETGFDPYFISSHGHTIFHDPANGYTTQIGSGAAIATAAGKPVVCDFRSNDICLGGQGAPLVPIGDKLLFGKYDACLNLGGFSNISLDSGNKRIAFDICPVNTVLNLLSNKINLDYDKDGKTARQGRIIDDILKQMNSLPYYTGPIPKSLGTEWLNQNFLQFLNNYNTVPDLLRTVTEHIAIQISDVLTNFEIRKTLITGGGAYNKFLIERLMSLSHSEFIIPDNQIIDFKEALIFAFLGLLRWKGEVNCLASATGASEDNIGGAIYLPLK